MAQLVEALRYNRKVTGLIPDSVIRIFNSHNPSSCIVALRSPQPLTEMITRNISWMVNLAGAGADSLPSFMCQLSRNMGASTSWPYLGP